MAASTAERLRELETFAAAFANFTPADKRRDSPGSGASGIWPEEEAVIFPMLRARDLREYYEAELRIFQDKALLERLLRKLLAHGESIAAPTGTTEIARTLDHNINRTDFLSPAARESFRDGLQQFRRYVEAVRRAGGYKFEFNREQWIFNYA